MTGFFKQAELWQKNKNEQLNNKDSIASKKSSEDEIHTGSVSFLGPKLFNYFTQLNKMPSVRGNGVSVSQMYYMCPRQVVLSLMIPKKSQNELIEPMSRMRMGFGTWAHKLFQDEYLGNMRVLYGEWQCSVCKKEIRLGYKPADICPCSTWCLDNCLWPEKYIDERDCGICGRFGGWEYKEPYIKDEVNGIKGKCDGVVVYNNRPVALEIKTKSSRLFDSMTEPDESHILQLNMYMHYLKLEYGLFMYLRKEEISAPKEFLIKYDPEIVKKGIALVRKLNLDVKEGRLPDKICDSRSCTRAMKCPWKTECFSSTIEKEVENIKRKENWPNDLAKKKFPAAFSHSSSLDVTQDSEILALQQLKLEELKKSCLKLSV